jgi:hypothetical protein
MVVLVIERVLLLLYKPPPDPDAVLPETVLPDIVNVLP